MKFEKKVALVTGAGSGIGQATAQDLAKEGAKVGVLDFHADRIAQTVALIEDAGGQALGLEADVSQADAMERAVQTLAARWGRLDILIANAGINGVWAPIDELTPDEWDRTLDINLKGTFLAFHFAVPLLKVQGGTALITSSLHGTRVFTYAGSTAYACSKIAQVVFAKKMALELARFGIRVNVVCPGSTDTRINETGINRGLNTIQLGIEYHKGKWPLTGNKASPHDIAELMTFLCSDAARTITGAEIAIDGGMSLMMG